MELQDYIIAWKKHVKMIVLITTFTVLLALLLSLFVLPKEYESTATVIINRENATPDIIFERNLIKVFSSIAESDLVAKGIIQKLNLSYTIRELRELIQIDMDEDTGVIKLVVRTNSQTQSRDIVQAFVSSLGEQSKAFLAQTYIHVIDSPKLPDQPARPNIPINMALAFLFGFMASSLFAILRGFNQYTKQQIAALAKLPCLFQIGRIPRFPKSGRMKWNPPFLPQTDKAQVMLREIRTNMTYLMERDGVHTLLITSPNPKEGKTILALNIAGIFAKHGKRVLLIDCNTGRPPLSLDDSLIEEEGFDLFIPPEKENLDLSFLKLYINTLPNQYDLILLDGPSMSAEGDVLMLSHLAGHVLLVGDHRQLSYRTLEASIQKASQAGANVLGIVVNFLPKRKYAKA